MLAADLGLHDPKQIVANGGDNSCIPHSPAKSGGIGGPFPASPRFYSYLEERLEIEALVTSTLREADDQLEGFAGFRPCFRTRLEIRESRDSHRRRFTESW